MKENCKKPFVDEEMKEEVFKHVEGGVIEPRDAYVFHANHPTRKRSSFEAPPELGFLFETDDEK